MSAATAAATPTASILHNLRDNFSQLVTTVEHLKPKKLLSAALATPQAIAANDVSMKGKYLPMVGPFQPCMTACEIVGRLAIDRIAVMRNPTPFTTSFASVEAQVAPINCVLRDPGIFRHTFEVVNGKDGKAVANRVPTYTLYLQNLDPDKVYVCHARRSKIALKAELAMQVVETLLFPPDTIQNNLFKVFYVRLFNEEFKLISFPKSLYNIKAIFDKIFNLTHLTDAPSKGLVTFTPIGRVSIPSAPNVVILQDRRAPFGVAAPHSEAFPQPLTMVDNKDWALTSDWKKAFSVEELAEFDEMRSELDAYTSAQPISKEELDLQEKLRQLQIEEVTEPQKDEKDSKESKKK